MWPRLFESLGIAVANLRENPLRTILSTLGVIIGVASLISVLAIGEGMERTARQEVQRTTGVQVVVLTPRVTEEVEGVTVPRHDYPVFTPADALDAARFSGAASANLLVSGTAVIEGPRGRRRSALLNGTLATNLEFSELAFASGRYFSEVEAQRRALVAVLSHRLGEELAPRGGRAEDLVGQQVRLGSVPFHVIGVQAPYLGERVRSVYVPYQTARMVLPVIGVKPAPTLYLKARTIEEVALVESRSGDWLSQRLGRWERQVKLDTSEARLAQVRDAFAIFKLFLGAITGISLVVGGIGIMNVLLASISERTREIGVRVALGARRRDIVTQFLAESVVIAGVGTVIGIVLGAAATFVVTAIMQATNTDVGIETSLELRSVVTAAAVAVTVGVCCGIYPAVRASRLSPIDAIRND